MIELSIILVNTTVFMTNNFLVQKYHPINIPSMRERVHPI